MIPIDELLSRLKDVDPPHHTKPGGPWTALCPAHDDRKRSLSIANTPDKILFHCFTRCSSEQIFAALGVHAADLFRNGHPPARQELAGRRVVSGTYDYHDERGALLYQVVRFEPKDFRPRRPHGAGGGWTWDLKGTRRVVYRLRELAEQQRVVWVEGEKDVDRLWALGIAATTSPSGAASWRDD